MAVMRSGRKWRDLSIKVAILLTVKAMSCNWLWKDPVECGWRQFGGDKIMSRNFKLDSLWLGVESANSQTGAIRTKNSCEESVAIGNIQQQGLQVERIGFFRDNTDERMMNRWVVLIRIRW